MRELHAERGLTRKRGEARPVTSFSADGGFQGEREWVAAAASVWRFWSQWAQAG